MYVDIWMNQKDDENKTKDRALVQNATLAMKINMLKLGYIRWPNLTKSNLAYTKQTPSPLP